MHNISSSNHNPIATDNSHTYQKFQTYILRDESHNRQESQEDRQKRKRRVPQRPSTKSFVRVGGTRSAYDRPD